MTEPMRIRTQSGPNGTVVRVLVKHVMESGQRKDGTGKLIPAWHITELSATLNGKPVFRTDWGSAVAKDPLLQFTLRAAKAGDKLAVTWKDSRGETRTDEATVA